MEKRSAPTHRNPKIQEQPTLARSQTEQTGTRNPSPADRASKADEPRRMEKALTPTQIAILHLIAAGRSTATTIAQHLGLQRSWVQECLSKLHSQEKITRKKAKKATVGRKKLVYRLNTSWECTGCAEPTYSGRYCTSCKQVFRRDRLFLQAAIAWAEQDFLSGKAVRFHDGRSQ